MYVSPLLVTLWLYSIGVTDGLAGEEFYLAFMGLDSNVDRDPQARIYVTNPIDSYTGTQVAISYLGVPSAPPVQTLYLARGESEEVTLSNAVMISGATKHHACAVVTSDSPVLVQASLENMDNNELSMAGYPVLPVTSLSGDYIVATHCITNECVFVVTSAEDGNAVEVHIRTDGNGSARYNGSQYSDGQQFGETLDRGQSLQVMCYTCDLTGTWVSASRKVIVVAGGDFTKYAADYSKQDAVADVMLPVNTLGRTYVLQSDNLNLCEIVKVVVLKAGDSFTYDGVWQPAATKDRQVYVKPSRAMSDVLRIESPSSPLLVAEVIASCSSQAQPDSGLTLALPVAQWSDSYTFSMPANQQSLFVSLLVEQAEWLNWLSFTLTTFYPQYPWYSESFTTDTSMTLTSGGLVLTIETASYYHEYEFSGFFVHNLQMRSSIMRLMPARLYEINEHQDLLAIVTTSTTTTTTTTTTTEATTTEVTTITGAAVPTETTRAITSAGELSGDYTSVVFIHSSQASNLATSQAINQVTSQASHQASSEVNDQGTSHASDQATNQATTQPTSQASYQDTRQATSQASHQATGQATSQASDQAISQASSQVTSPTTNQAADQGSDPSSTEVNNGAGGAPAPYPPPSSNPQPAPSVYGCGIIKNKCFCLVYNKTHANNLERKTETQNELLLDRKSLSSYIRRKTSAANKKRSSVYMGSALGASLLVTALAVIVLPDLLSLLRHGARWACPRLRQVEQAPPAASDNNAPPADVKVPSSAKKTASGEV